jgi:hypothetical protein
LSDLFAQALAAREVDVAQLPEYRRLAQECSDVKQQLREVTQRCDRLHDTLQPRGFRNDATAGAPMSSEALHAFGQHVRELNRLARRMKQDCIHPHGRRSDDLDC